MARPPPFWQEPIPPPPPAPVGLRRLRLRDRSNTWTTTEAMNRADGTESGQRHMQQQQRAPRRRRSLLSRFRNMFRRNSRTDTQPRAAGAATEEHMRSIYEDASTSSRPDNVPRLSQMSLDGDHSSESSGSRLQMLFMSLASILFNQQEVERAEADMEQLERSLQINQLQRGLYSLEQVYDLIAIGFSEATAMEKMRELQEQPKDLDEEIRCPSFHNHALRKMRVEEGWVCSLRDHPLGCHSSNPSWLFACTANCTYSVCEECVNIRPEFLVSEGQELRSVQSTMHNHTLVRVQMEADWRCFGNAHPDGCNRSVHSEDVAYRCANGCNILFCHRCAHMHNDRPVVTTSLHAHPLARANQDRRRSWICDGQTSQHGCSRRSATEMQEVPRYRCIAGCDFDLCETCVKIADGESDIRTSFMHQHPLRRNHQDNSWSCDAKDLPRGCRQSSVRSRIRYRCDCGCDFDLCGDCINLQPLSDAHEAQIETEAFQLMLRRRMGLARALLDVAKLGDQFATNRHGGGLQAQILAESLSQAVDVLKGITDESSNAVNVVAETEISLSAERLRCNDGSSERSYKTAVGAEKEIRFKLETQKLRLFHLRHRTPGVLAVNIQSRDNLLEESERIVMKASASDLHKRVRVFFHNEIGDDQGGISREWISVLTKELINPELGLFQLANRDSELVQITPNLNPTDRQLRQYEFVGRILGIAAYNNLLVGMRFVPPFFKMMLGQSVLFSDLKSIDETFYRGLVYLINNPNGESLGLTFELSSDMRNLELIPGGSDIEVNDENKAKYVRCILEATFLDGIQEQFQALMKGFDAVVPREHITTFNAQELELLLCGVSKLDIDDWEKHTIYEGYQADDPTCQHFWKVVRSLGKEQQVQLLQFVTGSARLPAGGFAELQGVSGRSPFTLASNGNTKSLPVAHTCVNRLDLPRYPSDDLLRDKLITALQETQGFGIA